ncbi:MAG TPA: GAF domain-containing protein [Anaerolineae bacterium]|nr:GAF domain-containing protein [Anaerolineae bacterium]
MATERVLVVDDAHGVIDFLSDYVLRPNGYDVLSAVDGEGGLSLAMSARPDLIILDLEMPRMSGMEVLEALNREGVDIPVIVITFHGSETIAAQTFRLGVKNYITKPFKMEEILEAIEHALHESRLKKERADLVKRLQQANKELERRIKEFNILHGIGQAMNSLLRLDDLLKRAVEAAVYVTGAQDGVLHLLDKDTGGLVIGARQEAGGEGPGVPSVEIAEAQLQEVIESGKARVLKGPAQTMAEGSEPEEGIASVLVVPLKLRGEAMGTLSVSSTERDREYSTNDKYLLSVLADYVAIGVENARLYESVQRRAEELGLLNEVGQALSSMLDLEQALTLVMERINSILKVEAGSLLLVDEEAGELVFQIALGQKSEQVKPLRLRIGQGIAGRVAETGQSLLIASVGRGPGEATAIDISTDFLARSVLCVPMVARGDTIGVIEVINKVDGTFTDDDRNLLISIANYAAVAIDNARLFRRFQSSSTE